jgi:acetyl/propionyl-CoA carboxylase alpha subunit
VTPGQALFTMVDEDHGRDLDAKRFDVASARVELKSAESSRQAASEQLEIYKSIALHKQKIAIERVNALTVETESAEKELARVEALVKAGMEPSSDLDAANAVYAKVKGQLSEAKPELELANDAVRAADHGSFYDGFRLVGELPDEMIREDAARARAKIADERLSAAQNSSGLSTYTVAFPGRVVRIAKSAGSTVNRGETLALIERVQETPKIYALLTQDQVARVQLGEKAVVRIPTLRQRFQAVVVRSDKTLASSGGALNDLLANPARPRSGELTGFVELELRPLTAAAKTALWSGMPAIVNLPRQPMRSPGQGLSSWLPQ